MVAQCSLTQHFQSEESIHILLFFLCSLDGIYLIEPHFVLAFGTTILITNGDTRFLLKCMMYDVDIYSF